GLSALGYIEVVGENALGTYLTRMRQSGVPDFALHPQTPGGPYYILTYAEPLTSAVGLNIAYETNRRAAAELARDSGEPTLSAKILLNQNGQQTPGFLMFYPVYARGLPVDTPDERRKALQGWVFAPILASNLLRSLTVSQGTLLNVRLYD